MRLSFLLGVTVALGACGGSVLPAAGNDANDANAFGAAPWPMVGGDPTHSSRKLAPRPNYPETQTWDFQADGVVWGSCVVAADGTIYFVDPAELYALTPGGQQKWKMPVQPSYQASPAVGADGTVYVGDGTFLEAVTPDGAMKWRTSLGETVLSSPTIAADGTIYVSTTQDETRGSLAAVAPSGAIRWTAKSSDRNVRSSTPAILPDGTLVTMQVSVYVGSVDGYSPVDGSHTFSQPHGFVYPYNVFPVVAPSGAVYVSTDMGLQVFDGAGNPSTTLPIGSSADLPPAVASDGTVYAPGTVDVPAQTFAVGGDGMIYAAGGPLLYAVAEDGTLVRTFGDLGSPIVSMLALDANDNVLFATHDGKVHARSL